MLAGRKKISLQLRLNSRLRNVFFINAVLTAILIKPEPFSMYHLSFYKVDWKGSLIINRTKMFFRNRKNVAWNRLRKYTSTFEIAKILHEIACVNIPRLSKSQKCCLYRLRKYTSTFESQKCRHGREWEREKIINWRKTNWNW